MAAYSASLPIEKLFMNLAGLGGACALVNTTICTLNEIADRKIDGQVGRCQVPIATFGSAHTLQRELVGGLYLLDVYLSQRLWYSCWHR
jgi:hypothetical protein